MLEDMGEDEEEDSEKELGCCEEDNEDLLEDMGVEEEEA